MERGGVGRDGVGREMWEGVGREMWDVWVGDVGRCG